VVAAAGRGAVVADDLAQPLFPHLVGFVDGFERRA
jgi:hypothetical protein